MEGLYTNQKLLKDYVRNGILHMSDVPNAYIAVAFFTEANVILDVAATECHIRLIVRLGFPTSPSALRKLISNKKVEIRFFSNPSFHPKLYIFGDKIAFVGSANLTYAAINSNQEIVVSIGSEDDRFDELTLLFSRYWEEASVLTEQIIKEYEWIYNKSLKASKDIEDGHNEVIKKFGDIVFSNIDRGIKKKNAENIFLDSYRRTYQESVTAFNQILDIYKTSGYRKVSEEIIPLRLEVDSFFSYVRDYHAVGESWNQTPIGWTTKMQDHFHSLFNEWKKTSWDHFEFQIAQINYPLITSTFATRDSINSSTIEQITETLVVLHSFHDRLRFIQGGLESLKKLFIEVNEVDRVRNSFIYLLFGNSGSDIVKRMSDLIYQPQYKLNEFGPSNVQELIGWINNEKLPVINGRTTKVLRYFGFDVKQIK